MDAKFLDSHPEFHPGWRGFKPEFDIRNGTPKAMPVATHKCAISIEVFYAGIRGNVCGWQPCRPLHRHFPTPAPPKNSFDSIPPERQGQSGKVAALALPASRAAIRARAISTSAPSLSVKGVRHLDQPQPGEQA
jgi:hypothetical protein